MTLAASDAKTYLADLVRLVNRQGESVVIERMGEAVAAIISFADFVEYELLRRDDMGRRYRTLMETFEDKRTESGRLGRNAEDAEV